MNVRRYVIGLSPSTIFTEFLLWNRPPDITDTGSPDPDSVSGDNDSKVRDTEGRTGVLDSQTTPCSLWQTMISRAGKSLELVGDAESGVWVWLAQAGNWAAVIDISSHMKIFAG